MPVSKQLGASFQGKVIFTTMFMPTRAWVIYLKSQLVSFRVCYAFLAVICITL
jgi:hypothetical protein